MASLAGFLVVLLVLYELGFDDAPMLMADPGRTNGMGLALPGFDDGVMEEPPSSGAEEGCWRMANTNVLLSARR